MKNKTLASIRLFFVQCTRYRKRIFKDPVLRGKTRQWFCEAAEEAGCRINEIMILDDTVIMEVEVNENISPNDFMRRIRAYTTPLIKAETEKEPTPVPVWTRTYLVTSSERFLTTQYGAFVDAQRKKAKKSEGSEDHH